MKINNKGQCPVCLIKPLVYKREGKLFCCRCDRDFNLVTGEWEPNTLWVKENKKSRLSKMAELAVATGIARPCDYYSDGLHQSNGNECKCGKLFKV